MPHIIYVLFLFPWGSLIMLVKVSCYHDSFFCKNVHCIYTYMLKIPVRAKLQKALSDLSWTVVLARMWRTVRFGIFPNYWLLFPTITVIINKPSPVIENMLISQMMCCRTQLEQKPIGHQTPEVMIWAPMFQVINGALESIIAGSSCEWLIWHCVVLFSQLEMKLGDTLIHA